MVNIDNAGSNAETTAVAGGGGNARPTVFPTAGNKNKRGKQGIDPERSVSSSGQISVSATVKEPSFSIAASSPPTTDSGTTIASIPSLLSSSSSQRISPSPFVLTSSSSISSQVSASLPSFVSTPTEPSVLAGSISSSSQVTLPLPPSIPTSTESSIPGPTSSTQRLTPTRLSTAERAGIIGAAIVVSVAFIGGWSYFIQRRKKLRLTEVKVSNDRSQFRWLSKKTDPHELDTTANIPEMDGRDKAHDLITKHNIPELDSRSKRQGGSTRRVRAMSPGIRHGLETRPVAPEHRITDEQYSHGNSNGNYESNEAKLGHLQERIERIREEKAMLERLKYLKPLEEETKQDMKQGCGYIC